MCKGAIHMPFYDLKCTSCNNEFNIMASINQKENNLVNCPKCGSNKLETVFKNINIITSRKEGHTCSGGCCGCPNAK